MAATSTFWFSLALLAVSFNARCMSSRVLQQAGFPPSPAPPVGAVPGQCPGLTFAPSDLPAVAANCTGAQPSQNACCGAVNTLWEDAGIASPQAAQILGIATVDPNTEQACLAVAQQALAPLGVTANLSNLGCAVPAPPQMAPPQSPPPQIPPPQTSPPQIPCPLIPPPPIPPPQIPPPPIPPPQIPPPKAPSGGGY